MLVNVLILEYTVIRIKNSDINLKNFVKIYKV